MRNTRRLVALFALTALWTVACSSGSQQEDSSPDIPSVPAATPPPVTSAASTTTVAPPDTLPPDTEPVGSTITTEGVVETVDSVPTSSTTDFDLTDVIPEEWLLVAGDLVRLTVCADRMNELVEEANTVVDEGAPFDDQIHEAQEHAYNLVDALECMFASTATALRSTADSGLCDARADELADGAAVIDELAQSIRPGTEALIDSFARMGELVHEIDHAVEEGDVIQIAKLIEEAEELEDNLSVLGEGFAAPIEDDVPWAATEQAWVWLGDDGETLHTYRTIGEVQEFCNR